MKILITGGAGFIGSNLTKKLLTETDYEIVCIDNFDPFYSKEIKLNNIDQFKTHDRFSLITGDIRDLDCLNKINGIDAIVHLAAKAGVRPSIDNPVLYQDVNVSGTQNLLEYARLNNIKQFVFASSSSVYGVNENVPWQENEKLLPISPYASTKLSCEMLGHVYSHLYNIRFLALRFFTVYGPGQRPDLAIHKFFKAISEDKPIPVFGDGTTSRDYTYVGDIIQGIFNALHFDSSLFEIVNIGNYNTITLRDLISEIEKIIGKSAIIKRLPNQPGDVPRTFADISKAKQLFDYMPSTSLQKGLTDFKIWFEANREIL